MNKSLVGGMLLLVALLLSGCWWDSNGNPVYSIGGSVSGLTGTGLVLQNNGGDDRTITASGPFAFATMLKSGSGYLVTIKTQPTSPAQTCVVTNAQGSIASADIKNVAVQCTTNPVNLFTVSGTVTGLLGTGLALQNNAGDDLPITADGAFNFSSALTSGVAYSVTVETQPANPSQTCTVSNGNGTISNTSVTNVAITCTTNLYTVGGAVSGLSGTLVLQNNLGSDLTITTNASFNFVTPVASGTAYGITIKTQPVSPSQVCTVTNGSGTISNANVTSVAVSCVTAPLTIITANPPNNMTGIPTSVHPVITFSSALDAATVTPANITMQSPAGSVAISLAVSGNQVTVTPMSALTSPTLYTLTITTGVRGSSGEQLSGAANIQFTTMGYGWGTAAVLEPGGSSGISTPRIGFDGLGNVLMIWTQYASGQPNNIWAKRFNGSTWGPAAAIESESVGAAYDVQLAVSANGSALALWTASDGSRSSVWSNHYSVSGGWGTAELIETDNAGNAMSLQLAIDANGDAFAVWAQEDNFGSPGHNNIWANHYVSGSGWGTPTLLEVSLGSVAAPQIAVDASGNAMAVWNQSDGGLIPRIMTNRFVAGIGWGVAETIGNNDTSGNVQSENAAQIAIDGSGNAIAVWMGQYDLANPSRKFIWANRFTPGSGWGTAVSIETNSSLGTLYPKIVIDSAGNAIAMWWQRTDSTHQNIVANRYSVASGWGTAVQIDPGIGTQTGSTTDHQIAMRRNGSAFAVWKEFDGTRNNLWSNHYTPADGWSTPQLIESNNFGDVDQQQVAVDQDGTALVVWQQSDGTSTPVWANWFQQIFL